MAKELMQVTEETSATIWEDGTENELVYRADGSPDLDPKTGEQKTKPKKVKVAVALPLHKGQIYPADHEYVRTWPHVFGPVAVKGA